VKVSGAQRKNAMVKSRFEPKTIPGYFGSFEIRKIEKSKFKKFFRAPKARSAGAEKIFFANKSAVTCRPMNGSGDSFKGAVRESYRVVGMDL
jgi:hypothetical protein